MMNDLFLKPRSVHTEHCCVLHGCKYGVDEHCEVALGTALQSYECEECNWDSSLAPRVPVNRNIFANPPAIIRILPQKG